MTADEGRTGGTAATGGVKAWLSWTEIEPWLLRVLWVGLAFVVGPSVGAALGDAGAPVRAVALCGLWAGWSAGTVAVAVAHSCALTAIRLLAPGALAVALAAAVAGHPSAAGVGWSVAAVAGAFSPTIGFRWVNGLTYPNETRHLLRVPAPLLAGPLVLAWAALGAAVVSGPLLMATRQWLAGVAALAVGAPVAWLLVRSLHNLSRRWAVFVPAGVVIHDPITVDVPVLFPRRKIASLGLATVDPEVQGEATVLDLSQRAAGLAVDMCLTEEAELTLQSPGRRAGREVKATRLRFTPTRPGAFLDEARHRRLPVTPA